MSWSLLLLVPSPCRICHLLIRGDMCGFSFPLFSPLAAALGFSLAPRRLGKRRTENLFRKHCFLCVLPISCNPNPDGYLEKSFRVGNWWAIKLKVQNICFFLNQKSGHWNWDQYNNILESKTVDQWFYDTEYTLHLGLYWKWKSSVPWASLWGIWGL